jgi:hypothetical protein
LEGISAGHVWQLHQTGIPEQIKPLDWASKQDGGTFKHDAVIDMPYLANVTM